MADLHLERAFDLPANELFDWITRADKLLQWWGPEGMHVPEGDLDFSRTGPWYSVMQNADGQRYKVSGQVTHLEPPHGLGLTWAWHDDTDTRGAESHVTLRVVATETGSRLIIDHRDLGDDAQADSHEKGWVSTLNKLSRLLH
ncbi:SRPBCC domain-containing protein [Sedimentitalea sp. HM32M-2]|uniref:SRPBCC family protein n=1 Tax=Sedimentitalea sp. HM32M-2 TaxID=3351566 RepID=UPI00362B1105